MIPAAQELRLASASTLRSQLLQVGLAMSRVIEEE